MKRFLSMLIFCLGLAHYPVAADAGAPPKITAAELERQIHQQINRVRQITDCPNWIGMSNSPQLPASIAATWRTIIF